MARIRTVKPEFWEDETIGALPRDARLMLLAMFNLADDEGILRWSPPYIKSSVFPYDDDLTVAHVKTLMAAVESSRIVFPYNAGADRGRYCWVVNFRKHQVINRPQKGKLPPPPLGNPETLEAYRRRDADECQLCRNPVNARWQTKLPPYNSRDDAVDLYALNPSPDHVIPRSQGGTNHPTNIRLVHIGCNLARGDRTDEQYSMPPSVERGLAYVAEQAMNDHGSFTDDSVNGPGTDSDPKPFNVPLTRRNDLSVNNHGTIPERSRMEEEREEEGNGKEVVVTSHNYAQQVADAVSKRDHVRAASALVNQFTDALPDTQRLPSKIRNDLKTEIVVMCQDGIDPRIIARGLVLWFQAGYPASTLATSVMHATKEANGEPAVAGGPRARRATGSERAAATLALAEQFALDDENEPPPDDAWGNIR